jgi:hypothetical protein
VNAGIAYGMGQSFRQHVIEEEFGTTEPHLYAVRLAHENAGSIVAPSNEVYLIVDPDTGYLKLHTQIRGEAKISLVIFLTASGQYTNHE